MAEMLFYILALAAFASGLMVVTRRSPLTSALWLVVCFLSLAGLMGLLAAPLVAALEVLIAAGAVMVLILFVVMLVDVHSEIARERLVRFGKILGAAGAVYLAMVMVIAVGAPPFVKAPDAGAYYSSAGTLGFIVLKRYAAAFEIVGVMMLVACVAAIVIVKRDEGSREPVEDEDDVEEVEAL
jgi:NADH-quinone oxidoreductase subunit J